MGNLIERISMIREIEAAILESQDGRMTMKSSQLRSQKIWETLGLLSDWLADAGHDAEREMVDWMRKHRKRPGLSRDPKNALTWYNGDKVELNLGDFESNIPEPLFEKLVSDLKAGFHKKFRTFRRLYEATYEAWGDAVREGWDKSCPDYQKIADELNKPKPRTNG